MKQNIFVRYGIITVACAAYALGFNWCFAANHISVGGFTGIAQIINFFLPWAPVGTMTLLMNIPLFLIGWKIFGRRLLISALYAMSVTSVLIDVFGALIPFQPMDPILAAIYGGIIVGGAAGVMMLQDANTGGTEMAARLLKLKFEGASIGTLMLSVDLVVTVIYALIFRDFSRALYGMVGLYVSSLAMDRVVYGANAAKVAYIISDHYEEITSRLLELERGVTLMEGKGAYSGAEKKVILCAFSRGHFVPIKRLIRQIDPDAFIIVCDAHEILGEGFLANTSGSL
ncbi:MAG: YitT family protein [Oscillospiraceae bacterium]|nr:YitT family protein [Oscillospiraceae bacterium]